MSAEARWVRLNVDWDESRWLAALPWHVRAAWPLVLCYVKKNGTGGRCREPIAARWAGAHDMPEEVITALLAASIASGALLIEDEHWVIAKWDEYQRPDTTNAERQKRFKERRSGSNNTVKPPDNEKVTPLHCHARQNRTEQNNDIDRTVTPQDPNGSSPQGDGPRLGKSVSRSEFLFGLLPETHRSPELLDAIRQNFKIRTEKRMGPLTETTLRERAKQYAEFTVPELVWAFRDASAQGWQGVRPVHGVTGPRAGPNRVDSLAAARSTSRVLTGAELAELVQ